MLLSLGLISSPHQAFADLKYLSEQEFRSLASELAQKVNLFHDVWEKDPEAIFYGGTTRDYLYWLKREFLNVHSRVAAQKKIQELRKEPILDVRRFIIGDSDVDVVSKKTFSLKAADYGVRKFDAITPDILDPDTEMGKNELWQGHAPAEKIQLHKNGLSQAENLGNGAHEIYTGKLSVHFSDPNKFKETKYAKAGENHPILLALRYLRLQAINYYNTYGQGYPDKKLLLESFDPESMAEVKKVIESALDGKELSRFLKGHRFHSWLNGTIQKAFRSYTNPTAALEYMKMFGVDQLPMVYSQDNIEPIYKYVFSKYRDEKAIARAMRKYEVKEGFFEPPEKFFPDGFLYHGTPDEASFRSILFQGILPSSQGNGGGGLYGVAESNKAFAETWRSSTKSRLLKFPVKSEAKIVDITTGEGQRVWEDFSAKNGKDKFDDFADIFGIDILKYPYNTEAFVVKNSDRLERALGANRALLNLNELLTMAAEEKDPEKLVAAIEINQLNAREVKLVMQENKIPDAELTAAVVKFIHKNPDRAEAVFGQTELWNKFQQEFRFALALERGNSKVVNEMLGKLVDGSLGDRAPWLKSIQETKLFPFLVRQFIYRTYFRAQFSQISKDLQVLAELLRAVGAPEKASVLDDSIEGGHLLADADLASLAEIAVHLYPEEAMALLEGTKVWQNHHARLRFAIAMELGQKEEILPVLQQISSQSFSDAEPWLEIIRNTKHAIGLQEIGSYLLDGFSNPQFSARTNRAVIQQLLSAALPVLLDLGHTNVLELMLSSIKRYNLAEETSLLGDIRQARNTTGLEVIMRYIYKEMPAALASDSPEDLKFLQILATALAENSLNRSRLDQNYPAFFKLARSGLGNRENWLQEIAHIKDYDDLQLMKKAILSGYAKNPPVSEKTWQLVGEIIGAFMANVHKDLSDEEYKSVASFMDSCPFGEVKKKFLVIAVEKTGRGSQLRVLVKTFFEKRDDEMGPFLVRIFEKNKLRGEIYNFRSIARNWLGSPYHKEIVAAYFQSVYRGREGVPEMGKDHPDWFKDTRVLRQLFNLAPAIRNTMLSSDELNLQTDTYALLRQLLMEDNVWEKDPDLLIASIYSQNGRAVGQAHELIHNELLAFLKERNVEKYPELVKRLMWELGEEAPEVMIPLLTRSGATAHPQLISNLMERADFHLLREVRKLVLEILKNPVWKDHPELIEELATYAEKWDMKKEFEAILALPHWSTHPRFQKLKRGRRISFWKLKVQALHRFQNPAKSFDTTLMSQCLTFFRKF